MKIFLSATLLALVLLSGAQAQERIRSGVFEVRVDDTHLADRCYSVEEVKNFNSDARTLEDWQGKQAAKAKCSLKDFKMAGNTVSFTLACADHTTVTTGTYRGDSFETFTTVTKGKEVTKTHMQGRRIGDCK